MIAAKKIQNENGEFMWCFYDSIPYEELKQFQFDSNIHKEKYLHLISNLIPEDQLKTVINDAIVIETDPHIDERGKFSRLFCLANSIITSSSIIP